MSVEIRPARPPDVPGIRATATAAWHEVHAPIVGPGTVAEFLDEFYEAESFRERIDDGDSILEVASDPGDGVVGYAFAGPSGEEGRAFDLHQIYVTPERWGEGIGRRLLERVEETVRDRGGERIGLGVMAENERARRFYEAAGYDRTEEFDDDRLGARGYRYERDLRPATDEVG